MPAVTERVVIVPGSNATRDAFGASRVSQAVTVYESKFLYDAQPLYWDDQQTSGGGTTSAFVANKSLVRMAVGSLTAGTRVRQTFKRIVYQAGKSHRVKMTYANMQAKPGITKRIGYFNDKNGLFLESTSTGLRFVRRTYTSGTAVDVKIERSAWDQDQLRGGGGPDNPSNITMLETAAQIFCIDFQWLSAGTVRYGFDINGALRYCHHADHANIIDLPYMQIPNLPLRTEISNDGTGAADSLDVICCCVESEGGKDPTGPVFSVDRGVTPVTTGNDQLLYPVVCLRFQTGKMDSSIEVLAAQTVCNSTALVRQATLLNPTFAGTALSWVALANSVLEYALPTSATTVTGGTQMFSDYYESTAQAQGSIQTAGATNLRLGSSIAGVSDILCLAAQRVTGGIETIYGKINWREQT